MMEALRTSVQCRFVFVVHVDGVRLCLRNAATMSPLFIPQAIYGCGEARWNDIDRETEELGEELS
jgi:hypothetical protein